MMLANNIFDMFREGDWTEQAGISVGEWKAAQREIEELNQIKERYDFLKKYMSISHISTWEKDGFVEMKTLYFQFADGDDVKSIDFAVSAAIQTEKDYKKV